MSRPRPFPLLQEERALLEEFFYGALSLDRLQLYEGGLYSLGSTRAVGDGIYFQPSLHFFERRQRNFYRSLLVHESTHVWQYQNIGWGYATGSLWDQLRATVKTGSRGGAYLYRLSPERHLLSYGYEQQAQLLQDYYLRRWHGDDSLTRAHCLDYQEVKRDADAIAERRRSELRR